MKACQRFFYLRTLLLYWCGAELFNPVPCCFYQSLARSHSTNVSYSSVIFGP